MKKLLLISSLVVASLLYGQGSQPVEIIEPDKSEQTPVTKPKKINLSDLMNKSAKALKKKNPQAMVYTAKASIGVGPEDPQYYDYLAMSYSEAVLNLKANMVLSKAGTIAIKETLSYFHKTIPDDKLNQQLQAEADKELKKLKDAQENADKIFKVLENLISTFTQKLPPEKKDPKFIAEIEDKIFENTYNQAFSKTAMDEITGLIPYETFIVNDEDGYQVGVLAYTTPNSLQLARDLKQGHQSKPTEKKEQCKNPDEIADALEDEDLLSHLGIKYFYNENCRPSILAYGMDSFIKEEGMNTEYQNESEDRARNRADAFISAFLSSSISANIKDSSTKEKVKKAMMKAVSQGDTTNYNAKKTGPQTSLIKEMSKDFSADSSMSLRGIEDARIWDIDKGDYRIVGVIRYYSMDSIEAANKRFDSNYETIKSNNTPKQVKPSVKHSSNLDVDDF
ncbi:hypothetical protein JG676_00135 [Campylobacter sp. 2018MI35]|uniref:hypothetical protein n=1 Tax=Campylobacter sp. 2018MI34 TaxID=2800582 RepID=UPI001903A552|nr:hypothetical protein [Campylobacter sp. 2018MI34]MBK1991041.1 hypothetical protein [Campylobacter sp. 2018MI34]